MSGKILFVFEGEKTERQVTENLTKYFISENSIIQCAYCNNIYHLLKELSEDTDLDTFNLLKGNPKNQDSLSGYNRNDFAEIYLFFDYDGHDTSAEDEKIEEALNFFKEETEAGKLYISYPMVEAIKHQSGSTNFKDLKVQAKTNIKYKQLVNAETKNELKQITKYTKEIWIHLVNLHLSKANYLTNGSFSLPKQNVPQKKIYLKQLEKYIKVDSTVSVLSSFPLFISEYYGIEYTYKLIR